MLIAGKISRMNKKIPWKLSTFFFLKKISLLSNSETADSFLNMTLETVCCFANNNDAGLMSRMWNISTFSLGAQDCFPKEWVGIRLAVSAWMTQPHSLALTLPQRVNAVLLTHWGRWISFPVWCTAKMSHWRRDSRQDTQHIITLLTTKWYLCAVSQFKSVSACQQLTAALRAPVWGVDPQSGGREEFSF